MWAIEGSDCGESKLNTFVVGADHGPTSASIQSSGLLTELCRIERRVRSHVGCDFGTLGNRYVFALHEQKQRRSREENNPSGDHRAGHCRDVVATAAAFDCAQGHLLSTCESNVVDIHVQFPCT